MHRGETVTLLGTVLAEFGSHFLEELDVAVVLIQIPGPLEHDLGVAGVLDLAAQERAQEAG